MNALIDENVEDRQRVVGRAPMEFDAASDEGDDIDHLYENVAGA